MAKSTPPKVHVHGNTPNITEDSRGTVIEAFCARCKPKPLVVPIQVYQGWTQQGYTTEIFCGDCVRELTVP